MTNTERATRLLEERHKRTVYIDLDAKFINVEALKALKFKARHEKAGKSCPLTNADHIRALTDEELAKIITDDVDFETIPFCRNLPECDAMLDAGESVPAEMCLQCALEWLRKPKCGAAEREKETAPF